MPPKRKKEDKGVDWRNSAARDILLSDLMDETLPLDEDVCPAHEAWEHYSQMAEFQLVPYAQFEKQLKAHREQVDDKFIRAQRQWAAFKRDRSRYPVVDTYADGRRIFRHSPAYDLLRDDVYNRRHVGQNPTAFQATRPEYLEWDLGVFTQRIYQMERQWKFVNYLEKKRSDVEVKKHIRAMKAVEDAAEARVNDGNEKKKNRVG